VGSDGDCAQSAWCEGKSYCTFSSSKFQARCRPSRDGSALVDHARCLCGLAEREKGFQRQCDDALDCATSGDGESCITVEHSIRAVRALRVLLDDHDGAIPASCMELM